MEQISDSGVDKRRRRRSREQVEELVVEFGSSGMKRSEFCRLKGLALNTLQRHLVRPKLSNQTLETIAAKYYPYLTQGVGDFEARKSG
jgi:hypothetical protein